MLVPARHSKVGYYKDRFPVRGVVYDEADQTTHYEWLVKKHERSLFVYFENVWDTQSMEAGGGTAVVRPLKWDPCDAEDYDPRNKEMKSIPRATWVVTGFSALTGGFRSLEEMKAREAVELSLRLVGLGILMVDEIDNEAEHIDQIFLPVTAPNTWRIGTGIFRKTLGDDVVELISSYFEHLPFQLDKLHDELTQLNVSAVEEYVRERKRFDEEVLPFASFLHGHVEKWSKLYKKVKSENENLKRESEKVGKGVVAAYESLAPWRKRKAIGV